MRQPDYVGEIDYHEFDRLVTLATGRTYESVAHNEWANDMIYSVWAEDPDDDEYNRAQLFDFVHKNGRLWANVAMGLLVKRGFVEGKLEDTFIVRVSW